MPKLRFSVDNLVFIDCEMSGLDPDHNVILEVAVVVVGQDGTRVNGPNIAILQSPDVLARMDVWNKKTHGQSGLLDRVRESVMTEEKAEKAILKFLEAYVPANKSPMCGNVLGLDRRFLAKYMPKLHAFFHYSDLDANCLEIFAKRFYPNLTPFTKGNKHNALADVHEAIDKIEYYRQKIMK